MKKLAQKGFTLIELIIVIAIIGILAAALLSALNPTEQLARASDSGLQVASKAMFDAMNRYYAQQQYYPNCTAASGTVCTDLTAGYAANSSQWIGATGTVGAPDAASPQGRLEALGELKTGFLAGVSAPASVIMTTSGGTTAPNSNPVVCYAPTSAAYLTKATYNKTGGAWSAGVKYICIK